MAYKFFSGKKSILSSEIADSFFLPCEFIKSEDLHLDNGDNNIYKRMYFKLMSKKIYNLLTSIINYKSIIPCISKICSIEIGPIQKHGRKNTYDLKSKLEYFNDKSKIFTPFPDTEEIQNLNRTSNFDQPIETNDIIIKSNIYDIEYFNNHNETNIINKLKKGQKIYGIFKYFCFIDYDDMSGVINCFDINLQLVNIYSV